MERPVLMQETDVGGGIWRIKWQERRRLLALACMHAGAAVLRFGNGDGDWSSPPHVVARHEKHQSMAYGIDWCQRRRGNGGQDEMLLASCSFYDHAVHLWRP